MITKKHFFWIVAGIIGFHLVFLLVGKIASRKREFKDLSVNEQNAALGTPP